MPFSIDLPSSLCFAELSGDFNPLHICPDSGETIVHGVHAFLRVLDAALASSENPVSLRWLRHRCRRPIANGDTTELTASVNGESHSAKLVTGGAIAHTSGFNIVSRDGLLIGMPRAPKFRREPAVRNLAECTGVSVVADIAFEERLARELLPNVSRSIPSAQLGTLLALSRIVGMECPGLNSLLMQFEGEFSHCNSWSPLVFRTTETDERLSLIYLEFRSEIFRGSAQVMLRDGKDL